MTSLAVVGLGVALPLVASPASAQAVPQLSIVKSHVGNFVQGQAGEYSIVVGNTGDFATTQPVFVEDALPTGLTATSISGTGWDCDLTPLRCVRVDDLAPGAQFPAITLVVDVADNAPANVVNTATATGGGSQHATATDPTTIEAPPAAALSIDKSHTGNFTQGGSGSYTIAVSNAAGSGTTAGTVTVTDTLPAGVTPTGASGTGWSCGISGQTVTCTRSDALAAGASYPPIAVTIFVTASAPCSFTNTASVSGGGSSAASDNDPTTVTGGTCNGGNGGNGGGGSLLPINLNGIFTMFNNISTNNNINSPGGTNTTNQNFTKTTN
ncbi:hypothetical protein ACWGH4_00675 [Streptomyces sp. NPDC054847]